MFRMAYINVYLMLMAFGRRLQFLHSVTATIRLFTTGKKNSALLGMLTSHGGDKRELRVSLAMDRMCAAALRSVRSCFVDTSEH